MMKSKVIISCCMLIFFVFCFSSCFIMEDTNANDKDGSDNNDDDDNDDGDNGGGTGNTYKYPKNFWGEWYCMGSHAVNASPNWYIGSDNILAGCYFEGGSQITSWKLEFLSKYALKVTDSNNKVNYLYAKRIPDGSIKGTLFKEDSSKHALSGRAVSGLGGINIIVSNLNNQANEQTVTTDEEGNFEIDEIIHGDEYSVTANGSTVSITPNTLDEDLGNIVLTEGVGVKASISPRDSTNLMRMFPASIEPAPYPISLRLAKIGRGQSFSGSYEITLPPGVQLGGISLTRDFEIGNSTAALIFGSTTGTISYTSNLTGDFEIKVIKIKITDRTRNTSWEDEISVKFNREKTRFYFYSDRIDVSGVLVTPGAGTYPFTLNFYTMDMYTGIYSLYADNIPRYSDSDYLIILKAPNEDRTINYALSAGTALSNPIRPGQASDRMYDNENNAKPVTSAGVSSNFQGGDLVYYNLRF